MSAKEDGRVDLTRVAAELVGDLGNHASGRTARTIVHGSGLRTVVMALDTGRELADHKAPGPAVLQVLRGELELRWEGEVAVLREGELIPIPDAIHAVHAQTRCAFMLTVALPSA